jgi:hypothetical protein
MKKSHYMDLKQMGKKRGREEEEEEDEEREREIFLILLVYTKPVSVSTENRVSS